MWSLWDLKTRVRDIVTKYWSANSFLRPLWIDRNMDGQYQRCTLYVSRPIRWTIAAKSTTLLIVFHCYRAHLPAIYATSHADHEERVAWYSISMHASGSVPMVMVSTPLASSFGPPEICYWQQVSHPYLANLYSPPLFPPPQPAGHMWIAVKAWKLGISDSSNGQS